MNLESRFHSAACSIGWGLVVLLGRSAASGQQFSVFPSQFELSGSVHLDEVDSTVRAHLERVKAYVADGQWDEAVETLRQVMENNSGKVINLTGRRYINLADYCHQQIASLPPPALKLYRQRVDPLAEKWYEQGIATRNAALLANVVDQLFCSSLGDDALLALGEIALEEGRPSIARDYWERIIERPPERIAATTFQTETAHQAEVPEDRAAVLKWYALDESVEPPVYGLRHDEYLSDEAARRLVHFWRAALLPTTRLAYPDTSLDLAEVRARLVLASILEGSMPRARPSSRPCGIGIPRRWAPWPVAKSRMSLRWNGCSPKPSNGPTGERPTTG